MSIRKVVPISEADWRVEPVPPWVDGHEPDWEFEAPAESAVAFLLADEQHHVASQAVATRSVRRVLTRAAVQALGQVEIDFDPAAQRLRINDLVVWRKDEAGAWQGRSVAHSVQFLVRQREQELEQQMLNGRASVVALVEDVRVGDAIDLSWTLEPRDPLPGLRFTAFHGFAWSVPSGASHFALHLAPDAPVAWRMHLPEGIEPPEHESTPGREHWWQTRPPLTTFEPNAPPGSWNFPVLEASAWESWNEVATFIEELWAQALADAPEDIEAVASQLRVDGDVAASVTAVIRFVQGDVRYLSVDFGHGAGLLPSGAGTVLRRRFGDCKDKTVLLTALLRRLGVEAWPLLVNPGSRTAVASLHPSLGVFNHVIVTFLVDGVRHFVDPTYVGQRGDLAHLVPPCYGFGLEVRPGATGLTPMPPRREASLTLTETFHLDRKQTHGSVEQVLHATSWLADEIRGAIGRDGQAAFFKARIAALQNHFPALLPDEESGEVREDPVSDAIELRDRHLLPTWGPKGEKPPALFRYGAHGLFLAVESLEPPEERTLPWVLRHPMRVRHVVLVKGRCIRRSKSEKHRHSGPGFRYHCDVIWTKGQVAFEYVWETTASRIEASAWAEYTRARSKAFENAGANVVTPSSWRAGLEGRWGVVSFFIMIGLLVGLLSPQNDRERTRRISQEQAMEAEVQVAWEAALRGNYAEAEPVFEKYQHRYAESAGFHFMRAEIAIRMGHLDRGREALTKARELDASNPGGALIGALLARSEGDVSQAKSLLTSGLERHPEDHRLFRELAITLGLLGDTVGARDAWGKVLALNPGNPDALQHYAVLLWHGGEKERADVVITGALAAQPIPSATLEAVAGEYYTNTGRPTEAIARLEKAVSLAPGDPAKAFALAFANLRAGRPDQALALATVLSRDFPKEGRSWHVLAVAKATTGDRAGAESAFQEWLRIAPQDAIAAANYGFFLHQCGRSVEARNLLAQAAIRFPGEGMVWLNYAVVLESLGEGKSAAVARENAERFLSQGQKQTMIR